MMSLLYIKSVDGKLDKAKVMIESQPVSNLKRLELKMDDQGNTVAVLEFVPRAVEVKAAAEVQEQEKEPKNKSSRKKDA